MKLRDFQSSVLTLASVIDAAWAAKNYEQEEFPDIAFERLRGFKDSLTFTPDSLLEEIQEIELPQQNFLHKEFSDFPLTLVRKEKFLIDMYIWLHSDTSIHNHHFSGAFKVMTGSSFQVNYAFIPEKNLGENLQTGDLKKLEAIHLPNGTVQKIEYQDKFIHHVLHLEQPTITLCVRTPPSKENALAVYLYPKYRLLLKELDTTKTKWLQAFNIALGMNKELVKEIPLSDCEIIRLIYNNHLRPGFLTPLLAEFFHNYLAQKNFAPDFIELMHKQEVMSSKLKKFACVTEMERSKQS